MSNKILSRLFLISIGIMLLTTIIPTQPAKASITTTYSDDFNSYSDNAAPSKSWYTFWTSFTYAKVNRSIYYP